jgi:hemoglobin
MSQYFSTVIFVFALQLSLGCSSQQVEKREQLYVEIGGHEGLENLVDAFVQRIVEDKVILPYFAKSSVKHFKEGFINHLCGVVNGPCEYNGDSMIDIHTGMNINEGDFNRVVELLIQAMEDVGITYSSQNKILAKLVVFRVEIIKI